MNAVPGGPIPPDLQEAYAAEDRRCEARIEEIKQRLNDLDVLGGLSEAQRTALATAVFDCAARYELAYITRTDEKLKRETIHMKRSPGQIRKLTRRVRGIQARLGEAIAYAESVRASGNEYLARDVEGSVLSFLRRAQADLDDSAWLRLGQAGVADPDLLEKAWSQMRLPAPPVSPAVTTQRQIQESLKETTVLWLWHALRRCGVGANEASRRTAKVGNALWNFQLAESVANSHTPERSPAVLKIVARYRQRSNRPGLPATTPNRTPPKIHRVSL